MKIRLIDIIATIAVLAAAQVPAAAHAETQTRSMAVSTSGLDLADPEDAHRMLRRIERAAGEVCGQSFARRYAMTGQAFRACRAETVAAAVHSMDQPMVTYAFEADYGASPMQLAMNQ